MIESMGTFSSLSIKTHVGAHLSSEIPRDVIKPVSIFLLFIFQTQMFDGGGKKM